VAPASNGAVSGDAFKALSIAAPPRMKASVRSSAYGLAAASGVALSRASMHTAVTMRLNLFAPGIRLILPPS
jgi:hypothetical protein